MSRLWTDDGRTTECEDRARILETEFAILETEFAIFSIKFSIANMNCIAETSK